MRTSKYLPLSDEQVAAYRAQGFLRVPEVFTAEEVDQYRSAAERAADSMENIHGGSIFTQVVDVWRKDDTLRKLTMHEGLAARAAQLSGVPLRLWHDQLLIKPPHNGAATEFHQDQPYWPHSGSRHDLSAWVALVDVPVERGCMTYLPGSQHGYEGLRSQDLSDSMDLFRIAPDLAWAARTTVPLRAGDVTFHNGMTVHTAAPNKTDESRIAQVVIYVDAQVKFSGAPHPVTDGLGLSAGELLPNDRFPAFDGF